MIDIHAHVLAGLDDGSRSIAESVQMLSIAAESGTTELVATPHANAEFAFDEERVHQAFRDLSEKAGSSLKLHLGCDFHLSYENLQQALEDPRKFSINRGRYLLVELPNFISSSQMTGALKRLVDARISPIITHPERNPSLQNVHEIRAWVESGCFIQITGQSFLGRFGRHAQKMAEDLIKSGLAHFVASDAHDCSDRTPDLSRAYQRVSTHFGEDLANALFIENPHSALQSDWIAQRQLASKKPSRLFSFFK